MKGFEVKFRGVRYKLGMTEDTAVISAILFHVVNRDETSLTLSGKDSDFSAKWLETDDLSMGDKIEIQIVELDDITDPIHKTSFNEKRDDSNTLKRKIEHYHRLKKELEEGGHI